MLFSLILSCTGATAPDDAKAARRDPDVQDRPDPAPVRQRRRHLDAVFEYTESWLRGRFDETDAKITGLRTEMVNQFGFVRRDIRQLKERVDRLEKAPMAAE